MRCPECRNFCEFAFIDDMDGQLVYHCRTVPVYVPYKGSFLPTLDHEDRYFNMRRERVVPVKVAKDTWVAQPYRAAA